MRYTFLHWDNARQQCKLVSEVNRKTNPFFDYRLHLLQIQAHTFDSLHLKSCSDTAYDSLKVDHFNDNKCVGQEEDDEDGDIIVGIQVRCDRRIG